MCVNVLVPPDERLRGHGCRFKQHSCKKASVLHQEALFFYLKVTFPNAKESEVLRGKVQNLPLKCRRRELLEQEGDSGLVEILGTSFFSRLHTSDTSAALRTSRLQGSM